MRGLFFGGIRVRHQEISVGSAALGAIRRTTERAPTPYQRQPADGFEKLRRNERRVVLRVHFSGPLAHETLARLAVNVCRREQSRERPPECAEVVRAPLRVRRWLPCELQILPEIFGEVGAAERALSIREERICRRWLTTNPKLPAILEPLLERRPRALVERDGASPVVVLRLAELRSATAALAVFGAQLERLVHLE